MDTLIAWILRAIPFGTIIMYGALGEIITEGEVVEIGGNDRYIAVCRKCWRNKRIEQSNKGKLPI